MRTSNRSGFRHWPRRASATTRTAVYGPIRTVVWQGSAGNRCPYADQRILMMHNRKRENPVVIRTGQLGE